MKIIVVLALCLNMMACIGTVVGAIVDTTIEVVKVPFKVGAAVIDVATGDEFSDVNTSTPDNQKTSSDATAVKMENAEIQ